MKYNLYLLFGFLSLQFFLGCSNPIKSIDIINENGKKIGNYTINTKTGLKEGAFVKYSTDGKKVEEANYKSDQLDGTRKIYDENGLLYAIENHKNGEFDGDYTAYFPNGRIKFKGKYVNNSMEGLWDYFYETGEKKEQVNMHNNLENGPFVEFYTNGNKKAEGNYKDGDKEDGLLLMYDETGTLIKKMNCKLGICNTIWKKEN